MRKFFTILAVFSILTVLFVTPVLAASSTASHLASATQSAPVEPADLESILLGLVGAGLSLAFKYVPKWKTWFDSLPHQGIVMLGFVVLVAAGYFALSCTPYAALLNITLACTQASAVSLFQAVVAIAVGNQLAYLMSPTISG